MPVNIIKGDVRNVLRTLPSDHFDCICTSPPYFGLRSYLPDAHPDKPLEIGLEPTLDAYLETMVVVCRELRRVLKPSGVFFINIGDSYAQSGKGGNPEGSKWSGFIGNKNREKSAQPTSRGKLIAGFKPKDLCLVPARLGIALQTDGWWVRSHIIWAKKNPMPESCTDRPTSAHETIWMLTKSSRYFWDAEAVKEPHARLWDASNGGSWSHGIGDKSRVAERGKAGTHSGSYPLPNPAGHNIRNVWSVASHPFLGSHFATMPPEIAERCIKSGSSEKGCCAACGAPWVRAVEIERIPHPHPPGRAGGGRQFATSDIGPKSIFNSGLVPVSKTIGWQPSCKCQVIGAQAGDSSNWLSPVDVKDVVTVPARILDPFAGAGTTGLVADRLGRDCTLIDLNTTYAEMALNRIKNDCPMFTEVAAE